MHQSKLIHLLKKIPKSEFKNIERFLQSSYHNTNKTVIQLFKYLCKYHPEFENKKLTKQVAYKKLFPQDKEFTDKKIRKLQSNLVKLLEEYIVIEEIKKDSFLFQYTLANALDDRNIFRYFESTIKNIQKGLADPDTPKSLSTYLAFIMINRKLLLHPVTKVFHSSTGKALKSTIDSFYRFSVLANLQFMAETFERGGTSETIYDLPLLKEAIKHAKIYTKENIIFEIHLAVIDLIEKKDEHTYRKLKELYFEYSTQITNKIKKPKNTIFSQGFLQRGFYQEQRFIYTKLHNFIIRKIYEGHVTYEAEQFELYKFGINNNLITSNNQIPDTTFINICISGSANKAFEWTKKFMTEYESYLEETCRTNAIALSHAFLHFHLKDYEKAFDYLNVIREKDLPYNFRIRSLWARCYYEFASKDDSYTQPLKDYIENYKQFINRSSLNEKRKLAYTNFCAFCKKLIEFKESKENPTQVTKQVLKGELDATYPIIARKWFVEKIEEL